MYSTRSSTSVFREADLIKNAFECLNSFGISKPECVSVNL
uniref:Uncharacterized protein n=1 Tax=Anguilla anguilla TaxID=7936 RepID=A0A0E9S3U5_ANGAN